jgi:hypothetical protein
MERKKRLPRVLFAYMLRIGCNVWHVTWKLDNAIAIFDGNYVEGALNPKRWRIVPTPDVAGADTLTPPVKELFIGVVRYIAFVPNLSGRGAMIDFWPRGIGAHFYHHPAHPGSAIIRGYWTRSRSLPLTRKIEAELPTKRQKEIASSKRTTIRSIWRLFITKFLS